MRPTRRPLTRILKPAFSFARTFVNAMPAARLTAVGAPPAFGAFAPRFRTLMMRPHLRSRMPGMTKRLSRIAENNFRSRSSCQTSSLTSRNAPRCDVPALFTKTSILPKSAIMLSITPVHSSSRRISADSAMTLPVLPAFSPSASISAFAASRTSRRRATIATLAPEVRKFLAMALPIPALPPVMIALRPSSLACIYAPVFTFTTGGKAE